LRPSSVTPTEIVVLLLILLAGALLRFGWVGVNAFAWDEARISLDALRMARGGEFVMAGQPSSVDIPFFPLSVWLFALPFALSPDPLFATLTVAAVSLLCVVGVWSLARNFGVLPGLAAAAVMAASPYAVLYGRSIWQPNLLAPLALAWLLAGTASVRRGGRGGLVAAGLVGAIGGMAVQVHFAGAALALATAYAALRHLRGRQLIALLIGGSLAIATAIPYVYYVTVVDPAIAARFGVVLSGGQTAYDLDGLGGLVRLALEWDWGFLGLGDADPYGRGSFTAIMAGALVGCGAVALLLGIIRRRNVAPITEMTAIVLLASPLFFIRHSSPVLIHYALIGLPAIAVLYGAALTLIDRRWWRIGGAILVFALTAIWSVQIAETLDRAGRDRPPNSALSSILSESRDAALTATEPILFFTHGDDPVLHGEAAVFKALLWSRDHRILNGDSLLILPPYPATLLATLAPFQMWEELEAAGLAREVTAYPRRTGALPFVAARYDGVSAPGGYTMIDPVTLTDGSTLIGWRARRVGDRLRISTLWRVEADAVTGTYQGFHHLRAADDARDGTPFAVSDVPLSRATWRVGDQVIVMADFFNVPDERAWTMDVGRYTLPTLTRIARVDGLNDGAIRLGRFTS